MDTARMPREELLEVILGIGLGYDHEELSWRSTAMLEHVVSIILKHKRAQEMDTSAMTRDQMISFLVQNDCYLRDELEWWGTDAIERTLLDLLKQGESK